MLLSSVVTTVHVGLTFVLRYFSLAHEIAHNLIQPHNAEHEFWFSSICERFMPAFTRLLATAQTGQ